MEAKGLQKVELALVGSEAEGFYGLLWGGSITFLHVLCLTPPKRCQASTTTVSKLPPQESKAVKPKPSTTTAEESRLAQEAPSLAFSQALEVAIPTHMPPLCLNVGVIKRVCKCWVEECSKGLSTSQVAICTHVCQYPLGLRLACPSCTQTFLNSDALRCHKKIHSSEPQYLVN